MPGNFLKKGGYIRLDHLDSILSFPELSSKASEFTFTYLHPGEYFLTVTADINGDGLPGQEDRSHPVLPGKIHRESNDSVSVDGFK